MLNEPGRTGRPLRKGTIAHAGIVVLRLLTIANLAGIVVAITPLAMIGVRRLMGVA